MKKKGFCIFFFLLDPNLLPVFLLHFFFFAKTVLLPASVSERIKRTYKTERNFNSLERKRKREREKRERKNSFDLGRSSIVLTPSPVLGALTTEKEGEEEQSPTFYRAFHRKHSQGTCNQLCNRITRGASVPLPRSPRGGGREPRRAVWAQGAIGVQQASERKPWEEASDGFAQAITS